MDPTETRFRELVRQITYKDWSFHIGKDGIGLYHLQVRFTAGREWSGRKWRLSMHMTDSEVVQTALKAVLAAEEHEAREQFRYRGRAIFGPHMRVEMLWRLAGDADALDERGEPKSDAQHLAEKIAVEGLR